MKTITHHNLNTISGGNPITINVCKEVTALFLKNYDHCSPDMISCIKIFEAYNAFFTQHCTLEDLDTKALVNPAWSKFIFVADD